MKFQIKIELRKQLDMVLKKNLLELSFPKKGTFVLHDSQSNSKKKFKERRHFLEELRENFIDFKREFTREVVKKMVNFKK